MQPPFSLLKQKEPQPPPPSKLIGFLFRKQSRRPPGSFVVALLEQSQGPLAISSPSPISYSLSTFPPSPNHLPAFPSLHDLLPPHSLLLLAVSTSSSPIADWIRPPFHSTTISCTDTTETQSPAALGHTASHLKRRRRRNKKKKKKDLQKK